ncbi:MAG: tyrosine-type recombinase/integrase, partial [Allosphingosinicella sp.]
AVFDHGLYEGLVDANPAAMVAKALKRGAPARRRRPAAVRLDLARKALAAIEAATGEAPAKLASRLLALTMVRPAVVRGAAWAEIEGIDWEAGAAEAAVWRVPPARMKLVRARKQDQAFEHVVALSRQAVALLREIRAAGVSGALIFPNARDRRRPMSKNALGDLYRRAGLRGRHVPHGWRAAFSTIMNERHRADRAVIDLVLAHTPKDKVEAAYNRAEHLGRRRELLQEWADLLDGE